MSVNAIEPISFALPSGEMHGLSSGDSKERIILCLHGWLDNAASFLPLMPLLSTNHRVIALDWFGHGLSSHRSEDAHYHFLDWIYDLLQLMEVNNWHNIDIVAHSMGAMVASAFAAAFPEKVKSLTLIDALGFITAEPANTTDQLKRGMLSRLKSNNKNKVKPLTLESAVNARVLVSDLDKANAELIVRRSLNNHENGYIWRSDPKLRTISPYRLTLEQAKQLVADINIPVQLIYGDKGLSMVKTGLEVFSPLIDKLTISKLSGGHHIHMEQPKQTAELIATFIQKKHQV